jgi:hypothetical protein
LSLRCNFSSVRHAYASLTPYAVVSYSCKSAHDRSLTHTTLYAIYQGIETKMHEDDDEEKKSTVKEVDYHAHSKQTKKRLRHVQRQVTFLPSVALSALQSYQ